MAGTTTHGLPYPSATDAPNIPSDMQNLATTVDSKLLAGGKSVISTSESRTNTAYGLLTTPDRVQNVVVPTDGLLQIRFHATVQETVSEAARIAIFIGSNQLKSLEVGSTTPQLQAAVSPGATVNTDFVVQSTPIGLIGILGNTGYAGDVTTGQTLGALENATSGIGVQVSGSTAQQQNTAGTLWGGICEVFLAAGTYDISVQYKSSSGSVTAKNRKLWVRALDFS